MTDINKKFEFPERLRVVYEDARARLKPHDDREGTFTGFPDDGKTPFVIDQQKCVKCGTCVTTCKFDAINVE